MRVFLNTIRSTMSSGATIRTILSLNEDAYRSTMVTALTGSLLMLTDKPAVYRTAAIEPAKRAAPVLFTRPGQSYDVDPSRSQNLERVNSEVSGSGPRVFDAGYTPNCFLYLLEINRPFDFWWVLGCTGGDFPEIRFADLGLDPAREYYVFEFWSKKLLGSFQNASTTDCHEPSHHVRRRRPERSPMGWRAPHREEHSRGAGSLYSVSDITWTAAYSRSAGGSPGD